MRGGAGRPGSRPLASDLSARGTKNALLGHLRRPPGAWPAWPPALRGIGERLRRIRTPLSSTLRRGNRWNRGQTPRVRAIVSPRRWREGSDPGTSDRRSDGLSASRARYRTAAPGSCAGTRPCRRAAIPSPRRAHIATFCQPESSSAYIHNKPRLTIPLGAKCAWRWLRATPRRNGGSAPQPSADPRPALAPMGCTYCRSRSHGRKIQVSCETSVMKVSHSGAPAGLA